MARIVGHLTDLREKKAFASLSTAGADGRPLVTPVRGEATVMHKNRPSVSRAASVLSVYPASSAGFAGAMRFWGRFGGGR